MQIHTHIDIYITITIQQENKNIIVQIFVYLKPIYLSIKIK